MESIQALKHCITRKINVKQVVLTFLFQKEFQIKYKCCCSKKQDQSAPDVIQPILVRFTILATVPLGGGKGVYVTNQHKVARRILQIADHLEHKLSITYSGGSRNSFYQQRSES